MVPPQNFTPSIFKRVVLLILPLLAIGLVVEVTNAAVVTNTADSGTGSLRQLIASAASGGTITFATNLSGSIITLTSGQMILSNNLTIDGSALSGSIRINGNATSRIFYVTNGAAVVLTALTLTNGVALPGSAGGGGIFNAGSTLTLNQCTLTGNYSTNANLGGGGGIFNSNSTLTLNQCTLTGNHADNTNGVAFGGGIYNYNSMLTLNECTLTGNYVTVTSPGGGGIYNFGNLFVNQSTVTGNSSDDALDAGGIYNVGSTTLSNSIVAGNFAAGSPGADIITETAQIHMGGTNIVQNYIQIDGGTFSGTLPITNAPQLAGLGNYGGPTQTMPPMPGSPAIDAGSDAASTLFATDQRGFPRRVGLHVDIGAVELQTPFLVVTNTADPGPGSLRQVMSQVDVSTTINFATNLSGSIISLNNGQLTLSNYLTIDASALPGGIQIFGNGTSRVFNVASGDTVVLTALTIMNGHDQTGLGGGGIFNAGFLTANQCTLAMNTTMNVLANGGGGGICNNNLMFLNQCTLTGNHSDNDASGGGGGGIFNSGNLLVNQCTLTGNQSDNDVNGGGGGIYNSGFLILDQSTLTGNHSDNDASGGGGGIYNSGQNLLIDNSIIAANTAFNRSGGDIFSSGSLDPINFSGGNIVQDYSGTVQGSAPIKANPQLAALGNYGGPTQTMPPLPGSPAINACINDQNFTTDQRGVPRIPGGISDIGSVELAPPTVATLPATAAVNSNATLNATVNPNALATTAWFQWGITNIPYANQTTPVALGAGITALAFSNNLTGLTPGVIYHCRVVATNIDGSTNGSDVLFGSTPIVTLVGAASITNECHTLFTDPGATNAAGLPVTVTGRVNTNSPNVYELTYTASNSLGLSGSAIRLVTVVDTTPPVITVLGNNPLTILTNTPFVDPGATALDACGGSFAVTANSTVNPAVAGNYTVTYSSTDSSGNMATAMRTVVVRNHSVFVTTTNDSGAGSLRQAIVTAISGDDIQFATNLSGTAILLTNGPLTIATNLAIDASALPGGIQINGNASWEVFSVMTNITVELTGLTITNGSASLLGVGGGIYNNGGTVTVNQCTIAGNTAIADDGGGVGGGGGIFNYFGTVTVNQSTLTGNSTTTNGAGGGIFNYFGTVTVNQSTLTGNSTGGAGDGGGIVNFEGTLTVNQCTLTGNSVTTDGGGGGIANVTDVEGATYVNQSTITGNHADNSGAGGGIYNEAGNLYISNSIVAGNTTTNGSGADIYNEDGLLFSGADIVEGLLGNTGTYTPINADPKLAPLGNYGGLTQTMPPLPGSPAVDACDVSSFTTDQRGFPRIIGAFPDIGAVEGVYITNGPGRLTGMTRLANGASQFSFTNVTDAPFTVLASTNVTQPMTTWTNLGHALESPIGSGQFHFTDPQATNFPQRFYRVRSP